MNNSFPTLRLRTLPLVLLVIGIIALARPAHAYIDPASGSMILQILVAAIAGALVTVRLYWQKICAMFGSPKQEPEVEDKSNES